MRHSLLNKQSILLLAIDGLFVLSGALSGTFLNVYLWKSNPDYVMIGWFSLAQQVGIGATFWVAGKWVKEGNKNHALRVGILLSGLLYLIVLWLGTEAVTYIWPLGILLGIALGLFWLSFNVIYFEATDRESRDIFNGWVGTIGSVTGIVAPWAAGLIISKMADDKGYQIIFTVSLIIYGLAACASFFLEKRQVTGTYHWLEPITRLREQKSLWRSAAPALVAQGIRDGVFAFLIHLLVFVVTSHEAKLGQFYLITCGVAFFSYYIIGKWFKQRYRYAGMLIGAIGLWLVIVPLWWKVNYGTLLFLGIGSSVVMPLYILPIISQGFDLMGRNQHDVELRVELVVLRELSLVVGRVIGILLFVVTLSFNQQPRTITLLLTVLGASPVISWFLIRRLFNSNGEAV